MKTLWALVGACLLAQTCGAQTTQYEYQSGLLTGSQTNGAVTAPFSTTFAVTLDLASPLPASYAGVVSPTAVSDSCMGCSGSPSGLFNLATNSSGQIIDWAFSVNDNQTSNNVSLSSSGPGDNFYSNNSQTESYSATGSGGSWAVGAAAAPEIDPTSAYSGLTLLLGGLAVLRGRRRQT
jgi:hypothetical protein